MPRPSRLTLEPLEVRCLLAGDITISEIMYHPPSGDVREEWIELYNRGDAPVNLQDYRIVNGVDFTFPEVTVAAGDYLVVAADVETFQQVNPDVSQVVGGWVGQLSNRGEQIQIEDGSQNLVDRVDYADSGEWSRRRLGPVDGGVRGWEWEDLHDGGGHTLELINADFSHEYAHNWSASLAEGGTPGSVNSVAAGDIAPVMLDVAHAPIIPTSADPVTVTVRLVNDGTGAMSASLFWRESTMDPGAFAEVPMQDDGQHGDGMASDGVYGAVVPAQADGTIIEFYVRAEDAGGLSRTLPGPTDDEGSQQANMLYQVDDTERPDDVPLYRAIATAADWDAFVSQNRYSDAQTNITLVSSVGGVTEVRYSVGLRYRGSNTRTNNPPNNRINIPSDRPWLGQTQVNINAFHPDSQIASSAVFDMAGLPVLDSHAIRMIHNGNDLARGGYFAHIEVLNSDWAAGHFPQDSGGNAYKGRRANEGPPGGGGAGLQYLGTNPSRYVSYLKGTNASLQDWSDVIHLTDVLNNTPDQTYLEELSQIADIDEWLRAIALTALIDNDEFGLLNGDNAGDDYAMYRGVEDPRFVMIPYDMDTSFGNRTQQLFRATGVVAFNRLLSRPEILPRYYAQLTDLMDNVLTEEKIRPALEQMLGSVEAARRIDTIVSFLQRRSEYVRGLIPTELTATSNLPTVGDFPRTTEATSGTLSGESNVIRTRSVRVAGQDADWDARRGRWSISDLPLQPGVNRILVQALDENGDEFDRTFIDIWRDDQPTQDVSGTISTDTTWTVNEGPYRVNGNVVVAPGVTLTLEPGTLVFFSGGSQLTVRGRLVAEGTEQELVRFTRVPGTNVTWGGLQFNGTMEENLIRHAVIEYGVTDNGLIGLQNSNLELDHVTLDHTDRRRIRTIDSSLVVRNSTFTDIFAPGEAPTTDNLNEHIWGSGIPEGGQWIVENNFFGTITGHNDGIDFDAPRRPQPIPQIVGNVFAGGGDDALDMTGDVYVEGNVFRNYFKDQFNTDPGQSNVISASSGDFTVVRNVFANVQHVSLVKEDAFMTFVNNTVVGSEFSALYFDLRGQTTGPGRGAVVDSSIFVDAPIAFSEVLDTTDLTVRRSMLPAADLARGEGNVLTDSRAVDPDNEFRLRPGSAATGRGANGVDMGAFVHTGASIAGEPAERTSETTATLTVGGPAITHYRFRVNDGPFSDETPISEPIELVDLADGTYTVHVVGLNSAGFWQEESEATASHTWTVDRGLAGVRLNEVLALNRTAVSHQGTFPDLIELFNPGTSPIDLSDMSLTDDPAAPRQFTFPADTTIGPHEYLVVYADDATNTPGIHVGFALNGSGDEVLLYDRLTRGGERLDSVDFGIQVPDLSLGRDDHGNWVLTHPTFGSENEVVPVGEPSRLRINEWLADNEILFGDDFIELYNPDAAPIPLGGLFVTDNPQGWPLKHEIAPLSFIAGDGGFTVLTADGNPGAGKDHVDFRLSRNREMIGLMDADGRVIDQVLFGPQRVDVSQGFAPDGSRSITSFTLPSPGLANPSDQVETVTIVDLTDAWRFEQSGTDLGTGWREPDFDDSAWDAGPALLYVENEPLPAPTNTRLQIGNPTYYFRRTFTVDQDPAEFLSIQMSTVIDDGAVVYLNGDELLRLGMPDGPIAFNTLANRDVDEAQFEGPFEVPAASLVQGENVLAVEVHQTRLNSTDIVFGLAIDAERNTTVGGDVNFQRLAENLRITELMYNPIDGSDFEFIELANTGLAPLNLAGVRLEGGIDFIFPEMTLAGEEHVVVVNDLTAFRSRYGTGVNVAGQYQRSLGNGGEDIQLVLPEPQTAHVLDFAYDDQWYPTTDGGGFSLVIDDPLGPRASWGDGSAWRPSHFVNGSPGTVDAGLDADILVINEILANTTDPKGAQIELHNTTGGPFNIGGWFLSDDASNLPKYAIPDGTIVSPGGYVVFDQQNDFGGAFTPGKLSGQVHLSSPDAVGDLAGFHQAVTYGAVDPEVTIGRYLKSDATADFVALTANTLGAENAAPVVGPVVINEIMFRPGPDGPEFIELVNRSSDPVSLFDPAAPQNTWQLNGAVEFEFPTGLELEPGGYLVIVGIDPNVFRIARGVPAAVPVLGPYGGSLDDVRDDIRLVRPGAAAGNLVPSILVDRVAYDTVEPWPIPVGGVNAALNRQVPGDYGNDAANWNLSIVDGTPGSVNAEVDTTPASIPQGLSGTVSAGPQVELSWNASHDEESGVGFYRIYRDGVLVGSSETTRFVDPDVVVRTNYTYQVTAVNRQGLESNQSLPRLVTLMAVDSAVSRLRDQVVLVFSEPVTAASAENPANYVINHGAQVRSALLSSDLQTLTLTTSPLDPALSYQLTIDNIESALGSHFPPQTQVPFEFIEGASGFTVRGVQSARGSIRTLASADSYLARSEDDDRVAATKTLIYSSLNFKDDDGIDPVGTFDRDRRFPTDRAGDDDNFVIQATGIITVPEGQGGDWTFGVHLAPTTSDDVVSEDGVRLTINRRDVLVVNPQNTPSDRVDYVSLSEGSHIVDLVFFEGSGAAELELFAARGRFTSFDQTDTWRLVGDVASGGLAVVTDPLPPIPVQWQRSEPFGSLAYDFSAAEPIAGAAATSFATGLNAGQRLNFVATPLEADAELTLELRNSSGSLDTLSSPNPGAPVALRDFEVPADDDYVVKITSSLPVDARFTGTLNTLIETESVVPDSTNDTVADAQNIDSSFLTLGGGLLRAAVRGETDGIQRIQSQSGNVFAPNELIFDFTDLPSVEDGPTLLISVNADLNGQDEFLALDAEGVLSQNLFVSGGLSQEIATTSIDLTAEQWTTLAEDGTVHFTVTPSAEVADFGRSQLSLVLRFGAADGDHYSVSLAGGEPATFSLATVNPGDVQLELIDAAGTPVALGIPVGGDSGSQTIRSFVAPDDGLYYLRVSGEPQVEYSLVVTRNADFDLVPNDQIEDAPDISAYGAVLGAIGGDRPVSTAPSDDREPAPYPVTLTDGGGFQWDVWGDGNVNNGSANAFDGGLRMDGFFWITNEGALEDDGREIVIGPQEVFNANNIEVTRKIYVPEDQGFVRFLEIVTNTNTRTAATYTVRIDTNLGSDDETTVVGTSSGDTRFTVADNWIVTDDTDQVSSPAVTHVIAGPRAARPVLAQQSNDNVSYAFDLDLEPLETKIVMHFAAQSNSQAEAREKGQRLAALTLNALDGISEEERSLLVNFRPDDMVDYYAVPVSAGNQLVLSTETPSVGAGALANLLDPHLELYGPDGQLVAEDDNGGPDGRNAELTYSATEDGVFTVGVMGADRSGEYILRASGYSVRPQTLSVARSEPGPDAILEDVPTGYIVDWSSQVDISTVERTDFTINGQPALNVDLVDGDSIRFILDPSFNLGEGSYEIAIAEGSISDLAGNRNAAFSTTFFLDATAPRVVSTQWNGQALPESRTFTVSPLEFSATFDESLSVSALGPEDVTVQNTNLSNTFSPQFVFFDEETNTVTTRFAGIPEGDYVLILRSGDEAFEDVVGNNLDGEANEASRDGTVSGNGDDGGDFVVPFRVDDVPHDVGPRLTRSAPAGSLIYQTEIEDVVSFAEDVDTFELYLEEGERLSLIANPLGTEGTLTVVVRDPNSVDTVVATSDGAGQLISLPTMAIPADGRYSIEVTGDVIGEAYRLTLARNAAFELGDTNAEAPLDATDSYVNLGAGRFAVVGTSVTSANNTLIWGVQPRSGNIVTIDPSSGTPVNAFPAPDALRPSHTQIGLTMAELGQSLLYINSDVDPTALYRLDPFTGEVLSVETVVAGAYDGLGFDSGGIFYSRDGLDIRRQQDFGGAVADAWATGAPTGALGGDDYDRLFGFFSDDLIHEVDTLGDTDAFLSTITPPSADVEGLAFDSTRLYVATASGFLHTLDPEAEPESNLLRSVRVPGGALYGLAALTEVVAGGGNVADEVEPNNSRGAAQDIDDFFNLEPSPNIGDQQSDTSTTIPHVTIRGSGDGTFDFYSFTVNNAPAQGIFDIDFGADDPFIDGYLRLYSNDGTLLAENDDFDIAAGQGGSTSGLDSYLEQTFTEPGTYFIEVGTCCVSPVQAGGEYELQVSIEGHGVLRDDTVPVVPAGSTWQYLDDGSDQGAAWRELDFDDSAWSTGTGQFGYGDGDESTVVRFGPDEFQKHITTYFRHSFDVSNPARFSELSLELLRDDGAAVYLNGVRVVTDRIAQDAAYDALASRTADGENESTYFSFDIDPRLLISGRNVLAVEVHQDRPWSDDLSFDLRLSAVQTRDPIDLPPVPDVDEYTIDLTGHAGNSIDIILTGLGDNDLSEQTLQLWDATYANVLATASTNRGDATIQNFQLGILDFVVPADGVYPIRVTSTTDGDYTLLVTDQAVFDTEPNGDSGDNLRSLDAAGTAMGFLRTGGGVTTVTDPQDVFGGGTIQPDIESVTGYVEDDTLTLTMTFYDDIPQAQTDAQFIVLFELDLDQNPATGQPPILAQFGEPAGQPGGPLGVELIAQIVEFGTTQIGVIGEPAGPQSTQIDAITIDARSVSIEIPLSDLNGDDGSLNFGGLVAFIPDVNNPVPDTDIVSDVAPNTVVATVNAPGAPGVSAGDLYEVTVEAGATIRLETHTPFDGSGDAPANTLDPGLQLIDPSGTIIAEDSNSAPDGKNALIVHTTDVAGTYRVHVLPEDGVGEYSVRLNVPGATLAPGDANGDGIFDRFDIDIVHRAGKYQTGAPATWDEGDWNGDGFFDRLDIVAALQVTPYGSAAQAAADALFAQW